MSCSVQGYLLPLGGYLGGQKLWVDIGNYNRLLRVILLGALGTISLAQAGYSAEIFKCTSWTNASLSHRGLVTVATDAEVLRSAANAISMTPATSSEASHTSKGQSDQFDAVVLVRCLRGLAIVLALDSSRRALQMWLI